MTELRYQFDGRDAESFYEFDPLEGGTVRLAPGNKYNLVPPLRHRPSSVSFGGLSLGTPSESTMVLDRIEYRQRPSSLLSKLDTDGWNIPFLSMLGATAAARPDEDGDESRLSRREVLVGAGAMLGGAALTARSIHAEEIDPRIEIAELSIKRNDAGGYLGLTGDIADVLPDDQEYSIQHDAAEIGSFSPTSPSTTIPPGRTGTVVVTTDPDISAWQTIQSVLSGSDPIEFETTLDKPAVDFEEDTEVVLASASSVVEPVQEAGADATVVEIDGVSIPHESESSRRDVGEYRVRDAGELVYRAGVDPPDGSEVVVRADVNRRTELKDDIARRT